MSAEYVMFETAKFLASIGLTMEDLKNAEIKQPIDAVEIEEGKPHEPIDMLKYKDLKFNDILDGNAPEKPAIADTPKYHKLEIINDDPAENKLVIKNDLLHSASSDN